MNDWQTIPSAKEWGRRGLSSRTRRIALAAVAAFLSDGTPLRAPPESECERVVDSYDLAVGNASVTMRAAMRLLLTVVEWLPWIVMGKASRMSRLPLADRVAFFTAMERHPRASFTMLLIGTKLPLTLAAYEEGDALKLTGFDRPTTASRRRLPRTS